MNLDIHQHHLNSPQAKYQGRRSSLLEIMWRRRRIVSAAVATTLVIGGVYLAFATRLYRATSILNVQRGGQGLLNPKADQPVSDNTAFLFTQREVISSAPVIAAALAEPGIQDLKTFSDTASAFELMQERLTVDVGKKDELITVSFDATSPEDAKRIVSAVVKAYDDFQSTQHSASTSNVSSILKNAKAQADVELAEKTKALQAFRREHLVVGGDDSAATPDTQRLENIAAALTPAHLDVITAKARYDEVERMMRANPDLAKKILDEKSNASLDLAIDDPIALQQKIAEIGTRLDDLSRYYLPDNPKVLATRTRLNELNVAYCRTILSAYSVAVSREQNLQEMYQAEQKRLVDQSNSASQFASMSAEVRRIAQLDATLDTRVRELGVTDEGVMATVQVYQPARAELKPSSPHKARTMGLALLAGLMAGAGLAVGRDRFDKRFANAEEVKEILGLRVLGALPQLPAGLAHDMRSQKALPDASAWAEACRSLRTAITFGSGTGRAKSIAITSPSHGDGRSTIASNLAASLAQTGKRVLIIDADMHAPSQHKAFGLNNDRGLIQLLESGNMNGLEIAASIQHTNVASLDVLPSGGTSEVAGELLNLPTFGELLQNIVDVYDHVVIDVPPIGSCDDARIVAAGCDATLLVVCAGKHRQDVCEKARYDLFLVGANVVGTVLNELPASMRSTHQGWRSVQPGEELEHRRRLSIVPDPEAPRSNQA